MLILNLLLICGIFTVAMLPGYAFGNHLLLIREQIIAFILICIMIGSVVGTHRVIHQELKQGSASLIMSHPVSSFNYLTGRWLGILCTLFWSFGIATVTGMWVMRLVAAEHHVESFGSWFLWATVLFPLVLIAAMQFLTRIHFAFWVNILLLPILLICFIILSCFPYELGSTSLPVKEVIDWRMPVFIAYIALGFFWFSAILCTLSIRWDQTILLAFALIIFVMGIVGPGLIEIIPSESIRVIFNMIMPDWQIFWISEWLNERETDINTLISQFDQDWIKNFSWTALLRVSFHSIGQTFIFLSIGIFLFNRREISLEQSN